MEAPMNAFTSSNVQLACRFLVVVLALSTTTGQITTVSLGRTFYVATNGTDAATCGLSAQPCRSISQAVANANDGDTVLVRPGLYGDLNNDGDFNDPGDEQPASGFSCMICVFKDVDIYSTHGAHLTVISSGDERLFFLNQAIELRSDGVTLGARDHGFTVRGGTGSILISGGRHSRVVGNIAKGIQVTACNGPMHVLENVVSGGSDAFL